MLLTHFMRGAREFDDLQHDKAPDNTTNRDRNCLVNLPWVGLLSQAAAALVSSPFKTGNAVAEPC